MNTDTKDQKQLGPLPEMAERNWLHVGWPRNYGDHLYHTALCGAGTVTATHGREAGVYVGPERVTCPDCARISKANGWR